tara:strand:+ start:253 stop:423 length:171 start_codon:yes stop_codon:yes gene_type:complete
VAKRANGPAAVAAGLVVLANGPAAVAAGLVAQANGKVAANAVALVTTSQMTVLLRK